MPTRPAVVASLALLLLPLCACSDQQDPAEDAARELVAALQQGDVTEVAGEEAQQGLTAVTEGLGDLEPAISLEGVQLADDERSAAATLVWTWPIGPDDWVYETEAELARDADTWTPRWQRSLVAPGLEEDEVLSARTLLPERAPILGAGGTALVRPRPVTRYGLDKSRVEPKQVPGSARRIAQALDVEVKGFVKLAEDSGPRAFVEGIVLRRGETGQVPDTFSDIPGAGAVEDQLALAPTREFAAPILGRVGPVTAEIVEESEGRYRAGDEAGLSGLQARYDEQLAGTPGVQVVALTESGEGEERSLEEVEPEPGEPLRLSLRERTQRLAESALGALPASAGDAALVAVRPRDGAILAAANAEANEGLNAATYGRYAPGSTFKVVTSLALLRSGLTADSPVSCTQGVVVDGKQFGNYSDYPADAYGRITLQRAVAESCNTAFINARGRIDDGELAAAAAALGLGEDFDLGAPAYFGQVPQPQSSTEAAADLIGQGRVQAAPMTMASVAASVAAGRTVVPWLLEDHRPEADPDQPLSEEEAATLRRLLGEVVRTGSGTALQGLAQGAKTGTAEYGEPGAGGALPTHAWMIAFRPDLAVAVFVEKGDSGSATAGPILADFLSRTR